MNPETKIILDELNKRFIEHDTKWNLHFSKNESRLGRQDLEKAHGERVAAPERTVASLDEWRSSIKGTVNDICLEVSKISHNWEHAILDRPIDPTGILGSSIAAPECPLAGVQATRPRGHHIKNYQKSGFGVASTLIHPPGQG